MTPAARVQAAIDILDQVIAATKGQGAAADTLIARYFAERRYAGSKDRRAVRELVYRAIRALGEVPPSGRAAMLAVLGEEDRAELFTGAPHAPAPYREGETIAEPGVVPGWLAERLAASAIGADELAALVEDRAPLDIRVNTLLADPAAVAAGIEGAEPIAGLPDALRLPAGHNVAPLAGMVEVQDAGSQYVALAADAQPGMSVVDLCAGGGGKTLALAAAMRNQGRILATDIGRDRLARLVPRAARAGITIAETLLLDPGREAEALADRGGKADLVLIDAPCSGTGTWRRNPEARWRLTPVMLDQLTATQHRLLALATDLVRPGGTITYIVCSLLDGEGADQVAVFLDAHPGWTAEPVRLPVGRPRGAGLRLTPRQDWTDGFFVATLRAPC